MMNEKTSQLAKKQALDHAEFLGEYTKYIYKHAHYHGFKHGLDHTQASNTSDYIKACKVIAKDLSKGDL